MTGPQITEEKRRLGIMNLWLYGLDVVIDMTVGDIKIEPAIQIIVKKEATETVSKHTVAAYFRFGSFVDKKSIALVVVEAEHLIREICDDHARRSGAIVIGGINSHSRARDAFFGISDARCHSLLRKRSVAIIDIELVRLRIVRDQQIEPIVLIRVEDSDAQAF